MSDASQLPADVREKVQALRSVNARGLPSAIEKQAALGVGSKDREGVTSDAGQVQGRRGREWGKETPVREEGRRGAGEDERVGCLMVRGFTSIVWGGPAPTCMPRIFTHVFVSGCGCGLGALIPPHVPLKH